MLTRWVRVPSPCTTWNPSLRASLSFPGSHWLLQRRRTPVQIQQILFYPNPRQKQVDPHIIPGKKMNLIGHWQQCSGSPSRQPLPLLTGIHTPVQWKSAEYLSHTSFPFRLFTLTCKAIVEPGKNQPAHSSVHQGI